MLATQLSQNYFFLQLQFEASEHTKTHETEKITTYGTGVKMKIDDPI